MVKPKIIALYLPQFHTIPENDRWWGKGFTEWTSVRKAKPLFNTHYQPKVPLDCNYYSLLDPDIPLWQAELAKKYGIYGFCYYHYWFKNGKKMLEKPAEKMLRSGKPDFPFCFSWANESWSRTWYSSKKETLLEQNYGGVQEWTAHFNYLLPFFNDSRYIKVENKPLFLIYKPSQILELDMMIELWTKLAKHSGFEGIHIVETLSKTQGKPSTKLSEAVMYYEPGYTIKYGGCFEGLKFELKMRLSNYFLKKVRCKNLLNILDYNDFYQKILERKINITTKKLYLGAFVDFDDTARRGRQAYIFGNVTPSKFENNLKGIIKKSIECNSDFIFLTAWNEWAEGAYLEPDNIHNFSYLEAVRKAQEL